MGGGGRPSQRYWVQARRSSRPQMMAALATASQNSTTVLRRSMRQCSLPYWLPEALGAFDQPPAAHQDRGRDAPGGNLAHHRALGQDRPAGMVAVAGVQVHHQLGGSGLTTSRASKVAASSPLSRWLAGAGTAASGARSPPRPPSASGPCLYQSTGLGPTVWPPQGTPWPHRGCCLHPTAGYPACRLLS
jgi:hypothetical protein